MGIIKKFFQKLFINEKGMKLLLAEAEEYESCQDYEGACYSYACAITQGAKDPKYKEKIKTLVKEYGPFTFEKQLENMKEEFCSCSDSCGEGYHVGIIELIEKIVNKNHL